MNPMLHRIVQAYRPLYLHGLLLDGPYRLRSSNGRHEPAATKPPRRRMLLVAMTQLRHVFSFHLRSKS